MALPSNPTVSSRNVARILAFLGVSAVGGALYLYGFWPGKSGLDQGTRGSVYTHPPKIRTRGLPSATSARNDTKITEPESSVPIVMAQGAAEISGLTRKILDDDGEVSDEFFTHFGFTDAQKITFKAVIRGVARGFQICESRRVEIVDTSDGSSQFIIHPFHSLGENMVQEIPRIFKRINAPMPEAAIEYLMTEATLGHEDYFGGLGQYTREFRVVREGGEYVMTETRILPGGTGGEPVRMDGPVRRFTKPPKRYEHLFESDANGKKE